MSWPLVALGELFEIARGGSPRPIDAFLTDAEDGVNWVSISDATESDKYIKSTKRKIKPSGISRSRVVEPGDFLLTNSMSFGRPYIMATSGCIHDGWLSLHPKTDHTDPDYLFRVLGAPDTYRKFERLASGATVKNLNIDLVRGVQIPLPSLNEQRRIATILDQAEAIRRTRKHALSRFDDLAQSAFRQIVGDPLTNSLGWRDDLRLGEVSDIVSGVTKGRKLNGAATRMVPYLAVANVQDRFLKLDSVKEIEATDSEIARYRLRRDDLLLTEGGDPDKLGRGALWKEELAEAIHQNHVFRVRLSSPDLDPTFLNWLVGSSRGKRYFLRSAKQTTGIASINMGQLKQFPLLIPPLDVQERFAAAIAGIETQTALARRSLEKLDALFASLQHRAFRGEL